MFRRIAETYNTIFTKELAVHCRFFLFLVLCLGMASCESDMATVKTMIRKEQAPDETGNDVEITYSENGLVKTRIKAPVMNRFEGNDKSTEFPEGVSVETYGPQMEVESTLDANYGILHHDKEQVYLRDDVVLVSSEGKKLNSEELTWDMKKKKIYSDKFVKITTPEEVIWGKGFEADDDFSWYRIDSISGSFKVDNELE